MVALPFWIENERTALLSALSERACRLIAERLGREIDYADHIPVDAPGAEPPCVVQFTETMKGFFSKEEKEDYEKAYQLGKQESSPCLFTLTIQTGDMNGFLSDPTHAGSMAGTVTIPALSSRPLMVSDGIFNLFVQDPGHADHLKMKYSMQLNTYDGKCFYFSGYKQIQDDKGLDLWQDTTRLFVTIYEGQDTSGPVVGKGVLTIAPHDFAIQMTTLKVFNAPTEWDKLKILKEFSSFFGQSLLKTYFRKMF